MADRYFSSNPEAGVVSRYGTGSRTRSNTLIGAYRDPNDPRKIVFTDEVVVIPEVEYLRFRREYDRAVRDGSLLVRTEKDHREFLARQAAASEPAKAEDENDAGGDADGSTAPKRRKGNK